jgi:hypothetical protein
MKGASSMNAPKQQPGAIIDPSFHDREAILMNAPHQPGAIDY